MWQSHKGQNKGIVISLFQIVYPEVKYIPHLVIKSFHLAHECENGHAIWQCLNSSASQVGRDYSIQKPRCSLLNINTSPVLHSVLL